MTEEKLQQQLYLDCACGEKIPLPVAVSAGKPIPWPKGDPVQNFCCLHCWEARPYSKGDVRRDVALAERQSPRGLKVMRLSTPCGHWETDKVCAGSIEILYVKDPRAKVPDAKATKIRNVYQNIRENSRKDIPQGVRLNCTEYDFYVCGEVDFKNLSCTMGKHKKSRAEVGQFDCEVDEEWK